MTRFSPFKIRRKAPSEQTALELIDIAELVGDEIDDHRKIGTSVTLVCEGAKGNALVLGQPVALRRLFRNLIENAITYGGEARVMVQMRAEHVLGTSRTVARASHPEARANVTQAFVRLEASRSPQDRRCWAWIDDCPEDR